MDFSREWRKTLFYHCAPPVHGEKIHWIFS